VYNILIKLFIKSVVKFAKLIFISSLEFSFRLLFFLGIVPQLAAFFIIYKATWFMIWRETRAVAVVIIVLISVLAAVAILFIILFSKVLTVCVVSLSLSLL
jgi:hypothetical protein